jgi:uncharacterized membrane protein YjdF
VRSHRVALAVDLAVKLTLIGVLLVAVIWPDLPQFEGKAMTGRALVYPISVLVVPVSWWIVRRRRGTPVDYPYLIDILFVAPFLIDTLGNAFDLYDSISWWDDANHFFNWGLLTAAFGQFLVRLPLGKLVTASLVVGFGAVTAILWEFAEYFTFIRGGGEEATAYTDTLGDMALGLTGSCVAALLTTTLLWPRDRAG